MDTKHPGQFSTTCSIRLDNFIIFIYTYLSVYFIINNTVSYQLSEHREEQEMLRSEILDAFDSDGNISYEKLNGLPYLDQCLNGSWSINLGGEIKYHMFFMILIII